MSGEKAHLCLADGTIFEGIAWGAKRGHTGEVVFTTGMTGYEEVLTDPSYCGQIVTMTAAQIGNTGINSEDTESVRRCRKSRVSSCATPAVRFELPVHRDARRVPGSARDRRDFRESTRAPSRATCAITVRRTAPSGPQPRIARPKGARSAVDGGTRSGEARDAQRTLRVHRIVG